LVQMEIGPPAILFPHCFIDERRLQGAMGLFRSLEICLPWEMDPKTGPLREEGVPFIRLLRPPATLKPGSDFGRRLAEYRQWIGIHQDKSVLAFLGSLQNIDSSEEKSWEIRKRMRLERGEAGSVHEARALKDHLVLHFAAETEESHQAAEWLIDDLRTSRSPLSGALEGEDEPQGFFDDLPSLKNQTLWQGHQWSQILEAWFGLFHQHLSDEKLLLTLDPRLSDFVKERFETALGKASDDLLPEMITLQVPELPRALSIDKIAETGRKFFDQGTLERLEAAAKALGHNVQDRADKTVKDPVVRNLVGKVLVILIM
jgi:hypothetical protein